MIGVKFNGRLGNQLFQFAFFRYLQVNNPRKNFFFINPHHSYISKYFDLGIYQNFTLSSKMYSVFARILPRIFKFKEVYIENIHLPKPVDVQENTIYKGFFQTDWYVQHTPRPLNFPLKKQYTDQFEHEFGEIFRNNKIIVVHIRRTDYLKYGKRDISLPMHYFKARLDAIENAEDYLVYFVSDDMEHVMSYFTKKQNYIFSSNSEIIDFQIIKNADIAIISNSSFAWWAAYLSEKNNTVYAPKNWLGFRIGKEHPKKVMTEKFIWCEVNP